MESPQQELQPLGRTVAGTFKRLVEASGTGDGGAAIPSRRRIAAEDERFRLWARSLGLFQTGHASLDYRVRDASFIKASLTNLLTELQDHLRNLLDIALGTRQPLERDENVCQADGMVNDSGTSDDEASLGSSLSSTGSFQEAEFRLSSVAARIDSLYRLASRIRSARNRPQRSTKDLYKHVPESQRAEYIQNQEQIAVSLVAYVQQQQLVEWVGDEQLQELGFGRKELIAQYASASCWLIARAGMANARRKQQFIYWKKHAQLLRRDVTEEAPAVAAALPQPAAAPSQAPKPAPAESVATSVTRMDLDMMGPEDMRSVISHRSRVSTVASPRGEDLAWPPAPSHLAGHKYFPCPYCGSLCPERYLGRDDWRIHQIHDLQPYHCTYEDCSDPDRLYGVKQEWVDHENQHRRVWHCHSHEDEFETQPEYLQHLKEQHPQKQGEYYTPEMIAAVVGPSAKPHRDCPFCPTKFRDVTTMQKHVRYHLERLALYALPDIGEDKDDELASERSSDSRQAMENRGRKDSIEDDFVEERQAFLAAFAKDDSGHGGPPQPGSPIDGPATTPPELPQDFEFDDTVRIVQTNSFANLNVSNTMSLWLAKPEKLRQETGWEYGDVFQPLPPETSERPMRLEPQELRIADSIVKWNNLVTPAAIEQNVPFIELNGLIGFQMDVVDKHNRRDEFISPLPFVFSVEKLPLYIDTRFESSSARYVRRSCKPNSVIKTFISEDYEYHFWVVSDRHIKANEQITIAWDFRFPKQQNARMLRLLGLVDEDAGPCEEIGEVEYQFIDSWVQVVLSQYGGCACNLGDDCAFVRFRRNYLAGHSPIRDVMDGDSVDPGGLLDPAGGAGTSRKSDSNEQQPAEEKKWTTTK
ncbi:hypothetical protein MAPG_07260 [Magnaporthiopsis poae ATCC 64411]|uniref:SET domain-containing protein n=1 Tax=Magnaporthiopsis poae (strain ATCC 64411 / 73-15) TaxID=644358 RepID=A0A0C4E471_MAGP6|nr:hypothetical protein MAPG_07260 [Magnaporthiopsis poae ATCC 64411]